jgi:hypothetical protein
MTDWGDTEISNPKNRAFGSAKHRHISNNMIDVVNDEYVVKHAFVNKLLMRNKEEDELSTNIFKIRPKKAICFIEKYNNNFPLNDPVL